MRQFVSNSNSVVNVQKLLRVIVQSTGGSGNQAYFVGAKNNHSSILEIFLQSDRNISFYNLCVLYYLSPITIVSPQNTFFNDVIQYSFYPLQYLFV